MSWAWSYASLAQERMTVRPHHCFRMCPSPVISQMTENVSLSTPMEQPQGSDHAQPEHRTDSPKHPQKHMDICHDATDYQHLRM